MFRRPDGKPYERAGGDYDRSGGSAIKTAFKAALRRAGVKGFRGTIAAILGQRGIMPSIMI